MNRLCLAAVAVAAVTCVAASAARADGGFLSIGFGPAALLDGDIDEVADRAEVAGRMAYGLRRGRMVIETQLFGTDLELREVGTYSTISLGLGGRAFAPLVGGLEAYGRAGADYTWLHRTYSAMSTRYDGLHGPGLDAGGGLQYRSKPFDTGEGMLRISLWLDIGWQRLRLAGDGESLVGRLVTVTGGFAFGTDL